MLRLLLASTTILSLFACSGLSKERPVTTAQHEAMLTIDDIAEWSPDLVIDRSKESIKATREFDGAINIEYKYQTEGFFISSLASIEPKPSDTVIVYNAFRIGERIGSAGEASVEQRERTDAFKWGDESRYADWLGNGKVVGFGYCARKDRYTWYSVVVGLAFEPEQAEEMLRPKLDKLATLPAE